MMRKLLLLLVLLLLLGSIEARGQEKKTEVRCKKVENVKPEITSLDCGKDKEGRIVLDIPEHVYQFPKGKVFVVTVLPSGRWVIDPDQQPKGSSVKVTPPCVVDSRPGVYKREALQKPLCNPELKP